MYRREVDAEVDRGSITITPKHSLGRKRVHPALRFYRKSLYIQSGSNRMIHQSIILPSSRILARTSYLLSYPLDPNTANPSHSRAREPT